MTFRVGEITGEFYNALAIAGIDRKKIRNVVRKSCTVRRKISLLKDVKIRKRLEENVNKLVDVGAHNLWGH